MSRQLKAVGLGHEAWLHNLDKRKSRAWAAVLMPEVGSYSYVGACISLVNMGYKGGSFTLPQLYYI